MIFFEAFTIFIYQPFLNILVGMYWLLGLISQEAPDMGVAVILLAVLIRLLLLPFSLAGTRTEVDRRQISQKLLELEQAFPNDSERFKKERKKLFSRKRGVLIGEMFSLFVQIAIALMLWKMFETGLTGGDLDLIYKFMPQVDLPFNLVFLDRFLLSEPSLLLNLILAFFLFFFETVAVLTSPYPPTKDEIVRLQLTLPIVSFIIFLRLPAGKLLFVLVTIIFSILLTLARYIYQRFMAYRARMEAKEQAQAQITSVNEVTESTVVDSSDIEHPVVKEIK
jgi:membrane protein insertase Oxa1/YidC/SpoIIIJ